MGVRLAAGLLIALAVGAQAGGWWLLGGVVVAGLLAFCVPETPALEPNPARLLAATRLVSRLALVPLFASVFAAYLFPGQGLAGAVIALVAAAADTAGLRLARYARAWLLGVLLVAGGGFVALSFAIEPAQPVTAPQFTIGGLFAAGAVLFPLLPRRNPSWLTGSVMAALAIGAGALYQLGPVRLALSGVPVRDALAALDGQVLFPLLAGVVVLSTVPAALLAMRETREELAWPRASVVCGLIAAAVAVLLDPDQALLLAAAAALGEVLVTAVLSMIAGRTVRAVITAVLAVTLLAWLPPVYLLGTVVAVAAGAAVTRRAGTPPP